MKNLKKISILLLIISIVTVTSCKKEEEKEAPKNKTKLIVHTSVDQGNGAEVKAGVVVHLRKQEANGAGNEIKHLTSDAQGVVTFKELSFDTYNIFCEYTNEYSSVEPNIVVQKDEEKEISTTLIYTPTRVFK